MKLKPGSLPVFTWKSLAACILWARWTFNIARTSEILLFLQHSVAILQTEALRSSFTLSKHPSSPLHVFNTKNITSLNPYKCRFVRSVNWDILMHQTQTLILTILPQLQSTPLLQTPLLAGQIASLVTMLKQPVDSFFTNPRGLGLPLRPCPLSLWWETWPASSCSSDGTERIPLPLITWVGHKLARFYELAPCSITANSIGLYLNS